MGKLWEKINANRFSLALIFVLAAGCGVESTDIDEGYGKAEKKNADSISFSMTELSDGQMLVTARRSDGTTFSVAQRNETELKIVLAEGVLIFDLESGDITVEEPIPAGVNLPELFLEIKQASEKMLGSLVEEIEANEATYTPLSMEEASLAWDDSFVLSPTQEKWIGVAYVSVMCLALGLEVAYLAYEVGALGAAYAASSKLAASTLAEVEMYVVGSESHTILSAAHRAATIAAQEGLQAYNIAAQKAAMLIPMLSAGLGMAGIHVFSDYEVRVGACDFENNDDIDTNCLVAEIPLYADIDALP